MNLKQSLFAIIAVALLASCADSPTPVNCKQYKTGKFRFSDNNNGKIVQYFIERNNGVQTEHRDGEEGTYKISWKDDCTYLLVFMNGSEHLTPEEEKVKRKMVIETTILSGTENYYIFESTNNLFDAVMKDTMWVIK
jgi:hypothetical protein